MEFNEDHEKQLRTASRKCLPTKIILLTEKMDVETRNSSASHSVLMGCKYFLFLCHCRMFWIVMILVAPGSSREA
jgi:hypothetical protein